MHGATELLEIVAPARLAADWDNSGWQVRLEDAPLRGVLLAVDADPGVVAEARMAGANLLLTHHPLFFRPPRRLDAAELVGATVLSAIRASISIFAAHTNLDCAPGGTSWALAERLGLIDCRVLEGGPEPGTGFGVVGRATATQTLAEWAALARRQLNSSTLALSGELGGRHDVVAVMGGSGSPQREPALAAGATLYVTADIRYHEAQQARAAGLSLIVVDHFASERPVIDRLANLLRSRLPCPVLASTRRTTPWEVERP